MKSRSYLEQILDCPVALSDTDSEYYREKDLEEYELYDGEYELRAKPGAVTAEELADKISAAKTAELLADEPVDS